MRKILKKELPFLFVCPALLWQALFLYVPLFILFLHGIITYVPGVKFVITLEHYKQILQPFSLRILGDSFLLALQTSLLCLLIAYPLAYFLTFKVKKYRTFFLLLVMLPSWTSWVVQIYAWFFLLKQDGIISQTLYYLGIFSQPTHLLNNHFSILVGMVYCYMPFMVLPIYAVLDKVDRRLLQASADLGASRWTTIKRVVIPMSISGVVAGLFLVFIPAFGEFAIPEFLGGSKKLFWGNVIVSKFLDYRDWQAGSAATYSGLLFPAFVILGFYLLLRIFRRLILGPRNTSLDTILLRKTTRDERGSVGAESGQSRDERGNVGAESGQSRDERGNVGGGGK